MTELRQRVKVAWLKAERDAREADGPPWPPDAGAEAAIREVLARLRASKATANEIATFTQYPYEGELILEAALDAFKREHGLA